MLLPVVRLKTLRQSAHPWIFRKMAQAPRVPLEPGALVRVVDREGRGHGAAFWHPRNTIALRMLEDGRDGPFGPDAIFRRLALAKARREEEWRLGRYGDCYRLANAEADGLPALVVDKYAQVLVAEPFCAGWPHVFDWVADALRRLYPGATLCLRVDPKVEAKEGVSFSALAKKWPAPPPWMVREHGLSYRMDLAHGHKTGLFLDQRPHRFRARERAAGREVLDLCCYAGGFSLNAALGGARSVTGVDLDEDAVAMSKANLAANAGLLPCPSAVRFVHGDAYRFLKSCAPDKFRLVVVDPPKLAHSSAEAAQALNKYCDLNRMAMRTLAEGGWLATCSCSGAVSPARWLACVRDAARRAGRRLAEEPLEGPGPDHPTVDHFPEGRYLKVLWAKVHHSS